MNGMATNEIVVQRLSVTSSKGFDDVVAEIEAATGTPTH
jgi:hypothetical protein